MTNKAIYSKEFAWMPTQVKAFRGEYIVIWLKPYFQKKERVSNLYFEGWITFRSLKPFPKQSHLKVVE